MAVRLPGGGVGGAAQCLGGCSAELQPLHAVTVEVPEFERNLLIVRTAPNEKAAETIRSPLRERGPGLGDQERAH